MNRLCTGVLLAALCWAAGCSGAQQATAPSTPPAAQRPEAPAKDDSPFKPYSEVITDTTQTDPGLFTVHRVDDKLYYEIPDSLLGREMLLVSRIAKTADNIGYGGEKSGERMIRWERRDNHIQLRLLDYDNVADEEEPIFEAVRASNFEPIIAAFEIEALSRDSAGTVIDVSDMFTNDIPLLGLQSFRREFYRVRRLDGNRTYIVSANSYPINVEVRHVLTYDATRAPSNGAGNSISLEMNQSMVLLPEEPMMPRLYDERVGYFNIDKVDYGYDAQRAEERSYIRRWRLECAGPRDAEGLCEPVKPIVYYLDPATPEKWRSYLKQGVDDWQVAFEAAGFKNAIYGADPPTLEEDPEFSPEDARYSVIRYFSSDIQNAYGPSVIDPRSGEILESDIGWFHNVMNLLRNWYFVQTAAVNPEARGVKFADAVMGELIRFVSAHEVGHTIGLPHNFGSSYAYPVDSLRSPTFTAMHGTAPSIMDYARFNYVAQPGDGVTNFMPRVGEYDVYSVKWGYTPIPEATTPDEEQATLDRWIVEAADDPAFYYGRQTFARIDPRSQNEDLTNDAVEASELGLANLKRITDNLVEWTTEPGVNYDNLEELYGQVLGQYNRYIGHVGRNIGGLYETFKTAEQDGMVYAYVPEEHQRRAMAFMRDHVFATPEWIVDTEILDRVDGDGTPERIQALQTGALRLLMNESRMRRMIEAEARHGNDTYTPTELLTDVRSSVWTELRGGQTIDLYRRNLQRSYIDLVAAVMEAESVSNSDIPAYLRGELETVRTDATRAARRTRDRSTQLHLNDVVARIDEALDAD
ncbi:MAG: zinc-dependent metalloprotease [Bacteroidota bacterium]